MTVRYDLPLSKGIKFGGYILLVLIRLFGHSEVDSPLCFISCSSSKEIISAAIERVLFIALLNILIPHADSGP